MIMFASKYVKRESCVVVRQDCHVGFISNYLIRPRLRYKLLLLPRSGGVASTALIDRRLGVLHPLTPLRSLQLTPSLLLLGLSCTLRENLAAINADLGRCGIWAVHGVFQPSARHRLLKIKVCHGPFGKCSRERRVPCIGTVSM